MIHQYVRDGDEIYRRSFATIRAEADLSRLPPDVAQVAHQVDHPAGVDHADRDPGDVGGQAGQIGLRADGGEGAAVDLRAVADVVDHVSPLAAATAAVVSSMSAQVRLWPSRSTR